MNSETVWFTVTPELHDVLTHWNINTTAYMPAYGGESAGLDLYYVGKEPAIVEVHGSTKLATGLKIALPKNYVGLILQRGSITKTTLDHRAGVVDPGYTGEIFVGSHLITESWKDAGGKGTLSIQPGEKLPYQLVVLPCVTSYTFCEEGSPKWHDLVEKSQRREACLGSTN